MRRLKSDVSHRIRPRQPSIFSAGWFRLLLGSGVAVILGLVVGPSIAGWFGDDLPRGVRLLAPWSNSGGSGAQTVSVERPDGVGPSAAVSHVSVSSAAVTPGPPVPATSPAGGSQPTAPPQVFRIQVGAFLDHRNADHLVERLRGEDLGAATSVFEQSRVLYRVLVVPSHGTADASADGSDRLLERVRALGFAAETTDEGVAVTSLVPLREAVEVSTRLREQGIQMRLKQEVGSSTYRVVRVGSYTTSEEAERALAGLVARGFDGFVVRER